MVLAQDDITITVKIKGTYLQQAGLPSNQAVANKITNLVKETLKREFEAYINNKLTAEWEAVVPALPEKVNISDIEQ